MLVCIETVLMIMFNLQQSLTMKKPVTRDEQNLFAVNSYIYFMANHWCLEESIRIFGDSMGRHFYDKWVSYNNRVSSDHATVWLWYSMCEEYRQTLLDAAVTYYELQLEEQ